MRDNFEDIVRSLLGGCSASVIKDTKLLLPCLDFFGDKPLDADEKEYLQSEILRLSESGLNFVQGYLHYINEAYEDAVHCYQKAADLGNVDAKYNLGYMNYHGKGCEVNCAGAILFFEEAIELEHMEAMFFRGNIYLFDKDDTPAIDCQKATDLFKRAIVLEGNGRSDIRVAKYFRLAAQRKDKNYSFYIKELELLKSNNKANYEEIAYQYAAATNRLVHCLKVHPNRIALFKEDVLLNKGEKKAIINNFEASFIIEHSLYFDYLMNDSERDTIKKLSDNNIKDCLNTCTYESSFFETSKPSAFFLRHILDYTIEHFGSQIAHNEHLAWFVTALLSRIDKKKLEDKHLKSLSQLRGVYAGEEKGRLFAIFLAYAECKYSICENSSIYLLNRQKRDAFSIAATTGQQINAWLRTNAGSRKSMNDPIPFFSPPIQGVTYNEIMAWIDKTPFEGLLQETSSIRDMIRNSVFGRPTTVAQNAETSVESDQKYASNR